MANLADVFTESERMNWLKAWLAIDIAKIGLEQFAENEATILQGNIYNAILTSGAVACSCCHTANVLKCPSPGICNKRGANGICIAMHDTASKQPRPCPANTCNKVLIEIAKQHKYPNPAWKNTEAIHWASCPWQIAKVYFPPDGYTGKGSAQDTDFNGIISFMINCKHFDNKFSFPIDPGKTLPPCLLTKARDIGRTVRHSSTCKVADTDLQDIFITLTSLLTDPKCLAHDVAAKEAVRKLAKLQTDVLKLTTEEIVNLLESAQDTLKKVEHITETAIEEIRFSIENFRKDLNAHNDKLKQDLDEHTGKCKGQLDEHRRKTTGTDYDQSCKDFRRRLMAHYDDTSSNVPLSNLDQSLDKRIADIYATPNIHRIEIEKNGKRVKQEQVLTYKQIFCTDGDFSRRIYLQGEPGSGKSTFSAKLVHDWSHINQVSSPSPSSSDTKAFDDVLTIQQFKFLFFVTLRDSRGQADVTQMIKKQLIDTTFSEDERADMYRLFVQIMNTEICLVVREGLDEWVPPNGSNLAEPSMAGFQNDKCTVLTTSRPWKLADERIKNSQIDILFEIEGISNPYAFSNNIIRCLIDHSKDLKETAIQFKSFVEDRKLEELSSSPMLYTLVIYTWVNTIEKEERLKESSLCGLYTTLLESLCKKANSTSGYFNDSNPPPVHCFSSTSYLQPNIEHLDKLAEVACKLLFSSQRESSIVFSDITLSNYFSPDEFTVCKRFALTAGILTNRKDKSRTGSSNSFVHKTVQELLAAYHIACNTNIIDDVISRYLKLNNTSYLEISQVLIFLCGMNTSAANKLSALMNHYDVIHCVPYDVCLLDWRDAYPCRFQRIIESGIREAVANKQEEEGIQLTLSHFDINERNIRELHGIWPTDARNVKSLLVCMTTSETLRSPAHDKSTSHFEFNLSSCHTLSHLYLSGSGILLRDTASSVRSEFPVCIVLNNANPAQGAASPTILSFIQFIGLKRITCSSTFLHNLFSTLLTLNHKVRCRLKLNITSCVEGSDIFTKASIKTNFDNRFYIWCLESDSPGLWEALHGLNIKSLSLYDEYKIGFNLNHKELFSQFLSSLTHLEKLSITMDCGIPSLCKALRVMNINDLILRWSDTFQDLTANHLELLSQSLSSLILLTTLSIYVDEDSPGLWEVLRGLNIKSLNLGDTCRCLKVTHVESLSESLASLTQLETLCIRVYGDNPDLWKALRGLNIKILSLSLENTRGDLTVDHGESLLRSTCRCLELTHVESLSESLASLTQLKTLSIRIRKDNPGLLEALRGLKIKSLSLKDEYISLFRMGIWKVIHVEFL
ncbi:uncharacterized protein LOC127843162 [Dreissena polymorpha]|uniref:NACHT domain-containing protein n=1 Tax=Dreissena polymorpha TaxID=45954 RepID=A0A9D4EVE7_DREPO|nr:uncharacterized protein LOC127843162 [Dreissena polymorpha]KAH3786526.1 hypothetical protein DPMN_164633 [Dreissena polymorpha]